MVVRGEVPAARAYHSVNVVGDCCYVAAGRIGNNWAAGRDLFACFDARHQHWLPLSAARGAPNVPPLQPQVPVLAPSAGLDFCHEVRP